MLVLQMSWVGQGMSWVGQGIVVGALCITLATLKSFKAQMLRPKAPSDAVLTHYSEVLELVKVMGGLVW